MKLPKALSFVISKAMAIAGRMDDDRVGVYAAQASFFIVISAVPFLMLLFTLLRVLLIDRISGLTLASGSGFFDMLSDFLPGGVYDFIEALFDELTSKPDVSLISVTAVMLLWSSSRGVRSVGNGIRNVYNTKDDVGFIKSNILSLIYTLVFIIGIVATAIVLFFGSKLGEYFSERSYFASRVSQVIYNFRGIVFFVVMIIVFTLVYNTLSRSDIPFSAHIWGAVFSSSLWLLFSWAYSIYINNFANYSYIYGSLTAVILLMLWLYAAMNILLVGAELNLWIYNIRHGHSAK
ncbi:MAG: YihY/virulence factor BrkB family protein [Eubacteriales bacterium]